MIRVEECFTRRVAARWPWACAILTLACHAAAPREGLTESPRGARQPQLAEPAAKSGMLAALAKAVQGSPYCAIVQQLRVEVASVGENEEQQIYHARVIETLRGPKLKTIRYSMSAESAETPVIQKQPMIVTLCQDADGYYWPGVGSMFPNSDATRATAADAARQTSPEQAVFPNCD